MKNFDEFFTIAQNLDSKDPLGSFRNEFFFPKTTSGEDVRYFAGNSLGLQPKTAFRSVEHHMQQWKTLAVEGHFSGETPWVEFVESLTKGLCHLTGALPHEVIAMNTLTVNLHLMMVSFYRPSGSRRKILIESSAFPSDIYAVKSQILFHGGNPETDLIELRPENGEVTLRDDTILECIEKNRDTLALVLFGNVNYLSGQAYPMRKITAAARKWNIPVGFDLAHGIGNIPLDLHDTGCDFAVWCHYKYLNAGPGAIAGAFIHERHFDNLRLPRFAGWWGQKKEFKFKMGPDFIPTYGIQGWQLSTPPTLSLAPLNSSLEIFLRTNMLALKEKADRLTDLFFQIAAAIPTPVQIVTPQDPTKRGTQLSLRISSDGPKFLKKLRDQNILCDFREPHFIRFAPAPLYTRFTDVVHFAKVLSEHTC
jgi:kynureninase